MASLNKVMIIGNLGREVETRYTPSGDAIANLALATSEQWKDKNGEKKEKCEWHRVVMYGRQAEIAGEYLKKGSAVYIEGRLQTRKWEDKQGQERYTTEIIADRMQMLGGRHEAAPAEKPAPAAHHPLPKREPDRSQRIPVAPPGGTLADFDEEIPF